MSDTKFNWQGDEDDATCRYGKYVLRVECLEHNCYWWVVNDMSWEGEILGLAMDYGYVGTMSQAKKKAEQIVNEAKK